MPARQTRSLLVALAATAPVAGCGDGPVAATPAALVGSWRSRVEAIQPQGSWQRTLVVHPDMRVESRGVTYGLYPGDAPGAVSASSALYGRLGATGTRFLIQPDSLVTEDRFHGPDYHHVQRDFTGLPSDSTAFEIRGGVLTLTYYSYPADAPVVTRSVYYRVR
jgi:hypothetical protein